MIAAGVDLGGTHVRFVVVDERGAVLGRARERTADVAGAGGVARALRRLAAGAGTGQPAAVGVAASGPLDRVRGTVENPFTLPGWAGSEIVAPLEAALGVPVALENDAACAALGEQRQGAAAGAARAYCITVGTGIGTGLVVDGRLDRGAQDWHPEGGHHVVDPAGPECYCGARGCVESLASGTAIAAAARRALAGAPAASSLAGGEPTAESVLRACRAGDGLAQAVVAGAAAALAAAVGNIANLFTPDVIVLGGGVMSEHFDLFEPAIADELRRRRHMLGPNEVRQARLGELAGAIGAAVIAREQRG